MGSHGHQRAICQNEIRLISEPLDTTEDIIPSAAIEAGRMIFEFVEDLIHLKRRQDRLDQHSRSNRTAGNA